MSDKPATTPDSTDSAINPVAVGSTANLDDAANNYLSNPPRPVTTRKIPEQRWQVFPAQTAQAKHIADSTALSPLLAQVLINRGIYTPEQAWEFLDPETITLPSPIDEFPDLSKSLDLLASALENQQKILICGDYDADGMTSTALLMRSLRYLGAQVSYAIPSRMSEGYGINTRIVEEFHAAGGSIILTVDNGIAAYEPIARARALNLTVILTDHHDVPEAVPPANVILNPKLIRENSPYRGVAGVGVAYILAVCLAQRMEKMPDLTATLLALFTLGTIADLAPLTGVNRRWVKRGLSLLPKSRIPGVQALIEVAGLSEETELRPEAIGFRLGPRINAVGRIADPQIVIELLTTDDVGVAIQRAMQCEEANKLRRQMCEIIENQAVEWCEDQIEAGLLDLKQERVLVVIQPEWHHGVIGIVASRLVERYGVPVFIGTYEDKAKKEIRGSARSIPEFNVFEALQFCDDLLDKHGGHRAAGGFSFQANKLRQVKSRLSTFACKHLQPGHLKPLVVADVQAPLESVNLDLYNQINKIHPCGIENPEPVLWSANATVVDQKVIGKNGDHLKLTLSHTAPENDRATTIKAIAWRWGRYYPLPRALDIAYKPKLNEWKGTRSIEIELIGVRTASVETANEGIKPWSEASLPQSATANHLTIPVTTPAPEPDAPETQGNGPSGVQVAREVAIALQQEISGKSPTPIPEPITSYKPPELPSIHPSASANNNTPSHLTETDQIFADPVENVPSQIDTFLPDSEQADEAALHVEFYHSKRRYKGTLHRNNGERQLTIENAEGHLLVVPMSQRQGFLHKPDEPPQAVDITDLRYFNLMRAGLSALEVKQKNQLLYRQDELLIQKDELIAQKDEQMRTLKAQMTLLEEKINQLSTEQQQQLAVLKTEMQVQESTIQGQEAHIEQLQVQVSSMPMPDASALQQQVRDAVGDSVWFCLQPASQKDLQAAYKNDYLIQTSGTDSNIADYSEAGIRLSFAIEREVLNPFFNDLYQYLLSHGISEVGGIALGPGCKHTLGMMPPLIAHQWRSFRSGELSAHTRPASGVTMVKVKERGQVSGRDREHIQQFFEQWEHPMATCLSTKGKQAASSLDQISKLRNISAHAESFLYRWQYELLHQLIAGKSGKGGLLRQLFSL